MSDDFQKLIKKSTEKEEENNSSDSSVGNVFKNLKKRVTDVSPPAHPTVGGEVPAKEPPISPPTSSKPKGFKLALPGKTSGVDPTEHKSTPDFSEDAASKEFQSPDQPDNFDENEVTILKEKLEILVENMPNKELVQGALKTILLHLERHPFLYDILKKEDCGLMVRALRTSYGVTVTVKRQKKEKKGRTQKDVKDVMDELSELGDITI